MAEIISAIDVEDALVTDLADIADRAGYPIAFSGTPISPDLGGEQPLPYAALSLVGGERRSLVVDERQLVADVYGASWADATAAADIVAGMIASLPYWAGLSVGWYDARIDTMPYELPDTGAPGIPRMRMLFTVIVRGQTALV